MSDSNTVTVYDFRITGLPVESLKIPGYKATLEAIRAAGGNPLPGTAQEVPVDEVDENGHYRRLATGWMPLV